MHPRCALTARGGSSERPRAALANRFEAAAITTAGENQLDDGRTVAAAVLHLRQSLRRAEIRDVHPRTENSSWIRPNPSRQTPLSRERVLAIDPRWDRIVLKEVFRNRGRCDTLRLVGVPLAIRWWPPHGRGRRPPCASTSRSAPPDRGIDAAGWCAAVPGAASTACV